MKTSSHTGAQLFSTHHRNLPDQLGVIKNGLEDFSFYFYNDPVGGRLHVHPAVEPSGFPDAGFYEGEFVGAVVNDAHSRIAEYGNLPVVIHEGLGFRR